MCGFIGKISDKIDNFEIYKESNEVISCRGPDETKHIFQKIDKILIKILYDRRLKTGISRKEASKLVKQIVTEIGV